MYFMAIFRKFWNKNKPTKALSNKLGKSYWGITSQYIKKNMLQEFVQKFGYDYKMLLERAISDSSNKKKVSLAALKAANN